MNAIEKIQARLQNYPHVKYQADRNSIQILPMAEDGFTVWLHIDDRGVYTVNFDGWHEHFNSEEEALNCLVFGLSNRCGLKVHLRGNFPYKWTVEYRTGEEWIEDSTTVILLFPFWKTKRIAYLKNDLIKDS